MTAGHLQRPRKVSVVGLGVMGAGFARHLRAAGHDVRGYDPDPARRELCRDFDISVTDDAASAITGAEFVLCSLPSASALRQTVELATAVASMTAREARALFIELSTLDLPCKLDARLALSAQGYEMLDCPVSGTGAQAAAGEVVVYASGETTEFDSAKTVLESFSAAVFHLGAFGNGTRMKLIANLLVAVHNAAAAEAITMAECAGIDSQLFVDIITAGGAAGSRVLELRGPMMAARQYTPATMRLDLWQKDLGFITNYAKEVAAPTPLFDAALPLYTAALKSGLAEADTAAICEVLRGMRADSDR
ncbi:MAG: NAD(P)-dependent oxidoreductase [Woeseia sp.]